MSGTPSPGPLDGAMLRWARGRRGRVDPHLPERAARHAEAALARVSLPPAEEFRSRGFRLQAADLRVGSVAVRARLDLGARTVTWDPAALADLARALGQAGLELPGEPLDLALAHELFHLLDPGCPGEVAEAAAHLFATRLLGLDFFAGEADLLARRGPRQEENARALP